MQVDKQVRNFPLRLAGVTLFAATVALGAAALDTLSASRDEIGLALITLGHVPTTADMDFAHRAFRPFHDMPPAPAFNAATRPNDDATRI